MLLIISNKTDLATDFIILRIIERKIPFLRLNTEDYLEKWNVEFSFNNQECYTAIVKNNKKFPVEIFTGAYIRQPKLPEINARGLDLEFSNREVGETLKSLWRHIPSKKWINAPYKILRASNKPEQLKIAQSLAVMIPPTLISTNHEEIQNFAKEHERIIVKAVKHGFLYKNNKAQVVATQNISKEQIKNLGGYLNIPMIFQKKIEKSYDIRVTVVGDKVFPAAIMSQDYKETSTDWRLADHHKISLKHEKINLPTKIESFCVEITKQYDLKYSAIDLVLSTDGEYFFLEMNPNGQWAWIEQVLKYPIRDTLIDEMIVPNEKNQ